MKEYIKTFKEFIPTWVICVFMFFGNYGWPALLGLILLLIQYVQIYKIKNKKNSLVSNFVKQEESLPIQDKNNAKKITLTTGRYVGGIDIPCGIYKVAHKSGSGSLNIRSNEEEPKWQFITFDLPENDAYNGAVVGENFVLEVDRLKVDFNFTREINAKNQANSELGEQSKIENEVNGKSLDFNFESMDGWQFEEFCASVLKRNGYKDVKVTSGSGDYGADIIAFKHNMKYAIQCKKYNGKIGNKAVQEAFVAKTYYKADFAVVMTNNYFTEHAIEQAKGINVILWDRDVLIEMIEETVVKQTKKSAEEKKESVCEDEKETYPAGRYVVGEDIEIGSYLLIAKQNKTAEIYLYKSADEEELINDDYFEDEYFISLKEKGNLLIVSDAKIRKF